MDTPPDGGNKFSPISDALTNSETKNSRELDVYKCSFILRYHELFGRVAYVGFFVRVIITPIIAIFIGAAFSFLFQLTMQDRASLVVEIFALVDDISSRFGGFNLFFFGPAFIPIFDHWQYSSDGQILMGFVFFKRAIFAFIVLCALAKGANTGLVLASLLSIYFCSWLAFWVQLAQQDGGLYFEWLASNIQNARSDSQWVDWMYRFSGFQRLIGQLNALSTDDFVLAMLPGLVFWLFSIVRLSFAINSPAGLVTYSPTFWVPYVSRGVPLAADKDPSLKDLPAATSKPEASQ